MTYFDGLNTKENRAGKVIGDLFAAVLILTMSYCLLAY